MISRRGFLRGRVRTNRVEPRPPWSLPEKQFIEVCTRCDVCSKACPERILVKGDGGYPRISFANAGCTFCGKCVDVCEPAALVKDWREDDSVRALPYLARVTDACVSSKGVTCRSCGDRCDVAAIGFRMRLGGCADVLIDADTCTGCGACLNVCPVKALKMTRLETDPLKTDRSKNEMTSPEQQGEAS